MIGRIGIAIASLFFFSFPLPSFAQGDEVEELPKCVFGLPNAGNYATRGAAAGYSPLPLFGYIRLWEAPSRTRYAAKTDGDPSLPCWLNAFTLRTHPFLPIPERYGLTDVQITLRAAFNPLTLPISCVTWGYCVRFGGSVVTALGPGQPSAFVTSYIYGLYIH